MRSSYSQSDVTILLKDITGKVEPLATEVREKMIQSGAHYCTMLPIEYQPTEEYMQIYNKMLELYAKENADAVAVLSDKIMERRGKGVVLVSLARAGIPAGILVKRYIRKKYEVDVPHYAISIIRGVGIDKNAMKYLLEHHEAKNLLFIDGWTGKGAINSQLKEAMKDYPAVSSELAVIADPAFITDLCGTHEDILIPSSCLNSTVSGLISRTFLRDDVIGENDFHGAVYYSELEKCDVSNSYINRIEEEFSMSVSEHSLSNAANYKTGLAKVKILAEAYGNKDINLIKPGIGETTRVLLRRVPWKILINEKSINEPGLKPIIQLAKEKGVPIEFRPLVNYKACGIIKEMADA